jgi:hypothetical protein
MSMLSILRRAVAYLRPAPVPADVLAPVPVLRDYPFPPRYR